MVNFCSFYVGFIFEVVLKFLEYCFVWFIFFVILVFFFLVFIMFMGVKLINNM